MKGSMFEEGKNDILKDMYGEDISMVEQSEASSFSPVPKNTRAVQQSAPRTSSAAKTWAKRSAQPPVRKAAARPNDWNPASAGTAQKRVKSGNGWFVIGLLALIFTVVLAPAIASSGMQSMLRPNRYEERLVDMLDKNQPARAMEFIRENQLDDYDKRDASYAHLVTQAEWDNTVLETIDQWQLFVSVIAGQREADLSYMGSDLAFRMEKICTPDDDVTAAVPAEDVERGREAVRGMLLMLGDDGTVFEALCNEDYGIRSTAADVIKATLDDMIRQTGNTTQEDVFFDSQSGGLAAPLNEEV